MEITTLNKKDEEKFCNIILKKSESMDPEKLKALFNVSYNDELMKSTIEKIINNENVIELFKILSTK